MHVVARWWNTLVNFFENNPVEELLSQNLNITNSKIQKRSLAALLLALPLPWRRIAIFSILIFTATSVMLLVRLNDSFLVEIPKDGGTLTEGIIGRPRFINPVIARSDADRDIAELVYSGLIQSSTDNQFTPDLAESYDVSPDGLTYTFTLRENLFWHDGEPITSADVAFTIDKVRDPGLAIKSPRRASWEGVSVETPSPNVVVFHLKQPYAPFLENATMGILPKHIWVNVPNGEFDVTFHNIKPIGSGPYRISGITQDADKGLPKHYDLVAFKRYARGEPHITNLRIIFFGNNNELSQAYASGQIDQMHSIEPTQANELEIVGAQIRQSVLPRAFAGYFNQTQQPIFTNIAVRKALSIAVDKDEILNTVLLGYGRVINGPLPFAPFDTMGAPSATNFDGISEAKKILEADGWVLNANSVYEKTDKKKKTTTTLEFSLAVPDVPELRQSAELLRVNWERVGARVTVKVFELATFSSDVLTPRKYDVLFFGQVIGRTPDLFAYWHSSQRHAPGLNIALYANKKVDKILEDARKEKDDVIRNEMLTSFLAEINSDIPAFFVYSPDFLYATGKHVRGIQTGLITTESERFLGIENWYIESERVWKWFADRSFSSSE